MKRFRTSYNAGWRAGMAGTSFQQCPLKGFIARECWLCGWEKGVLESLARWREQRARAVQLTKVSQ